MIWSLWSHILLLLEGRLGIDTSPSANNLLTQSIHTDPSSVREPRNCEDCEPDHSYYLHKCGWFLGLEWSIGRWDHSRFRELHYSSSQWTQWATRFIFVKFMFFNEWFYWYVSRILQYSITKRCSMKPWPALHKIIILLFIYHQDKSAPVMTKYSYSTRETQANLLKSRN